MQPSQTLTADLAKSRASRLAPTADGLSFAYTVLDVGGLRLAGSLDALGTLPSLIHLDLSDNRLSSLEGLEGEIA